MRHNRIIKFNKMKKTISKIYQAFLQFWNFLITRKSIYSAWWGTTSSWKNFRTVCRNMSWSSLNIFRVPMSIMFAACAVSHRSFANGWVPLDSAVTLLHRLEKKHKQKYSKTTRQTGITIATSGTNTPTAIIGKMISRPIKSCALPSQSSQDSRLSRIPIY